MQTISQNSTVRSQAQLIEAARLGETSGLVEYIFVELLPGRAVRLVKNFRDTYGAYLDAEDVAMAGIERVLRSMDKAMVQASNPIGWLLWSAQLEMLHYCQEQRSPIRVSASSQYHQGAVVPVVKSLDAPLIDGEEVTLLDLLPAP
ncbi:MAG: hypothetical protein ACRDHW_00130 [Ktedonobacteraceae bacterium]